jgi:HEPN domain-containing protein/predicted nucleotidyltransferase
MGDAVAREIAAGREFHRKVAATDLDLATAFEVTERIRAGLGEALHMIVLFGSRARGDARPDSDFDFLVIADFSDPSYSNRLQEIRRFTGYFGHTADYILATPAEFETKLLFRRAVKKEGVILYMNDEVGSWLNKARSDARMIEAAKQMGEWDQVCFHSQQLAEKLIKALIHSMQLTVPRTHDLEKLCALLQDYEVDVPKIVAASCAALQGLDVMARYPGFDATSADADTAWVNAQRIQKFVEERIGRSA